MGQKISSRTKRESPRRGSEQGKEKLPPDETASSGRDMEEGQKMLSQDKKDIESGLQRDLVSQQPSGAQTVCPKQPPAEVHNLSIVDPGAVFFGPVTGITVNQNVHQNVTAETPDPAQVQAVADKAKDALKKVYTTTGSYVQMLPWVDDDKKHIMDIYTRLGLVEQVDTRRKIDEEENKMESYEDIFLFKTREGNPIKRVIICGSAGIGKTTLIDKIAYDWAMGKSETLNKYEFVSVLKMRSLKQSSDLMDAIFDQLLDKDSVDKSILKEFLDKNQDKVLILLDGFDELQTTTLKESSFGSILKVLNRKQGTECWVVVTSRPPLDKLVGSSLVEKPFTHVNIEGFSDTDIEEYVNKFFPVDLDKARKLIEQIKLSSILSDLAKSPMLLLLLCLLWDAENTLPNTMTQLYNKALKYIFKRKERNIGEDAISNIMIAIGKVALIALISTNQLFSFIEEDFEKSALDAAMRPGILTSERVVVGLDTYKSVYFIHLTFLEYCAAMYWQSLIDTNTEEFNRILHQIGHTIHISRSRYDYLLRFCCGDNESCTNRILQKIHHERRDPRLALVCYFESQSKELPPENVISSVLTDDVKLSHFMDSKDAFIYFLKHMTGQSRRNTYFNKVKKLNLSHTRRHTLQRFGEDLAISMKLMTNLQRLYLSYCSLTAATTEEILSSLTSSSIMQELNLSYNEALGGSLSLLASQLTKMERLQKLFLPGCSLIAQDLDPITESLGDTLATLDLSLNKNLGGCASIWAPPLGKMECLENLYLGSCSLIGTDIEPIAVALRGVSYLDLTSNEALGGCVQIWGPHLMKMEQLQEVYLCRCSLENQDVEPIAESVSGMPHLVHLNLSFNKALSGCASSWAPHLKQMTKHLKKLSIQGLKDEDKEHITASIGLNLPILEPLWLTSQHR